MIKAYTDIPQSKKLAEILPHITADDTWEKVVVTGCNLDIPEEQQYVHRDIPFTYFSGIGVPCWSLAALLDILPKFYNRYKSEFRLKLVRNEDNKWCCCYEAKYYTAQCDNPIDACYEFIIWLNEQKLL